ncbi:MAG: hypothetical protein O3A21_07070 [Proteobacteria bacterium]|nr:hypothetical protein [Pseudomonadota bacterium]
MAVVSNLNFTVIVTEPGGGTDVTVTITVPTTQAALIDNPLSGYVLGGNIQARVVMRVVN